MKNLQKIATAIAASTTSLLLTAGTVWAEVSVTINRPKGFSADFGTFFSSILRFAFAIAAIIVFFYLVWGGIDWITSGGDKGKTEGARNKITAAVIGLIILAAAWAILTLILNFLNFGDINDVFKNIGTIEKS